MDEMYKIMIRNNITPNQFYVLWSIQEGTTTPTVNLQVELRMLKRYEFIDLNGNLTEKAKSIIRQIESYFKVRKKKTSQRIMGDDFNEMIDDYRDLFPKIKFPSGKPARSAKKNLETAFRWFFENYDYSWETILKATSAYLDEKELENWSYAQNSQYFIRKQNTDKTWGSALADYCQLIEDGGEDQQNNPFKEKVY